ncbi:MAG TPA: ABC transporter ATP-binding protein [Herpetosiphon sp.]|uniref:ABC transporter related n=1 Tax=Herpetosiphon aurantiacus (strain ATCC 23779 / DSM 785 / 114-95) TaxID=316274 RepID=A9AWT1_HERA2|nr:ABC transporter transmembrane domain-containing protein [Herpetosiphon sp.]ABX03332.1 ABC transporter related [Herpetosiphon aurantiacus DSM 785]HBW50487.1 ABC transporter ATP-binding protein [Herpetosiphon sp.]
MLAQAPKQLGNLRHLELRRMFQYVYPYRWRLSLALLCLAISSGIGLVMPLAIRNLVETVKDASSTAALDKVAIGLMGVFIAQMVFNYIQGYFLTYVGERAVADLRIEVYSHLQRLSLAFFSERRVGELTSRVTNDVTVIQGIGTNAVAAFLQNGITFIGSFIMMINLSWQLTAITLLLIPLLIVLAIIYGRRIRNMSTEVQDRMAEASSVLEETISGVRIVQSFAREPYEVERFSGAIEHAFSASMRRTKTRAQFVPIVSFSGFGALVFVLWFGGRQVLNGTMQLGDLIAFLLYAAVIAGSLGTFTSLYSQLQEALGSTARVFGILDTAPEIASKTNAINLPPIEGEIYLEDVSFNYGEAATPVLSNINLKVEPGEVMAIVGPSGSGKSTLVNLIPRFYDVTAGRITVDGFDIRDVDLPSLRSQIGIVPQETLLFSGTIADNIRYGNLDAPMEAVIEAAKAANAHEFISNFEGGYESIVGERGIKLSGGQRQRVAIARALLKNPRILILDEATSAMDSESEGLVQEALERLMQGRTTFVIAHRLSTVKNATRIAVIEAGKVTELGSHSELLAQAGTYARLYQLQFETNESAGSVLTEY